MTEPEPKPEPSPPESVTVQAFTDLQIAALNQSMFVTTTLIQKVINLEKAVEELKK